MLVLSRGRNDKVVFPTLGISVEILRVAGNKVRLGIDAPHEVPVHRHEVSERMEANGESETVKFPSSGKSAAAKLSHDMRNRLNAAALGLGANAVRLNLIAERDAIRERLIVLGDDLVPPDARPAAARHTDPKAA